MNGTIEVVLCERGGIEGEINPVRKVRCITQNGEDVERFAIREVVRGVKKYRRADAINRFFGYGKYAVAAE